MQNDINDLRADMREVKPAVSLVEVLSSPGMTTHLRTRYGAVQSRKQLPR